MLLSKYIKGLQEVLKKYGDLPCYYSSDDEGNSYKQVNYDGTIYYTPKLEYLLDQIYGSNDEYIENCDYYYIEEDERVPLIPICIVN